MLAIVIVLVTVTVIVIVINHLPECLHLLTAKNTKMLILIMTTLMIIAILIMIMRLFIRRLITFNVEARNI